MISRHRVGGLLARLFPKPVTRVVMARPYEVHVDSNARQLEGRVAVVTGATGAIGRAVALRFALEGAHVVMPGRSAEKLAQIAQEVESLTGSCDTAVVDLESESEVSSFFAALERVDVLVNCAGGSARGAHARLWSQSPEVVDQVLGINFRAVISCTQAASALMVARGGGSIISIGSIIGGHGKARFADYAGAKAGLVGYMKTAAIELGPHDVTVNVVSPGLVPRGQPTESELARIRRTNVLGRVCSEEDVAEAVLFLASDRSRFITGQELFVDGGRSLGLRGDS